MAKKKKIKKIKKIKKKKKKKKKAMQKISPNKVGKLQQPIPQKFWRSPTFKGMKTSSHMVIHKG